MERLVQTIKGFFLLLLLLLLLLLVVEDEKLYLTNINTDFKKFEKVMCRITTTVYLNREILT